MNLVCGCRSSKTRCVRDIDDDDDDARPKCIILITHTIVIMECSISVQSITCTSHSYNKKLNADKSCLILSPLKTHPNSCIYLLHINCLSCGRRSVKGLPSADNRSQKREKTPCPCERVPFQYRALCLLAQANKGRAYEFRTTDVAAAADKIAMTCAI